MILKNTNDKQIIMANNEFKLTLNGEELTNQKSCVSRREYPCDYQFNFAWFFYLADYCGTIIFTVNYDDSIFEVTEVSYGGIVTGGTIKWTMGEERN